MKKLSSAGMAVMVTFTFAGHAQGQNQNSRSQGNQQAPQKQAESLQGCLPIADLSDMGVPGAQDQNATAAVVTTPHGQSERQPAHTSGPVWFYGAFLDAGYLLDFNHPANDLFRSRGTAYKVDYPLVNMAAAYIRKAPSESSRWGMELTTQGGQDSRVFGFSATAPNLPGFRGLRHLGPTDVSYLAPVGKGLTIQAGIFSSLIGYDSLYAKDNFNYTRPWGADLTPYLMMGVNARYPLTERLTVTVFVVNGYWHLANANHVPNSGAQIAYKVTGHTTLKETVLFG